MVQVRLTEELPCLNVISPPHLIRHCTSSIGQFQLTMCGRAAFSAVVPVLGNNGGEALLKVRPVPTVLVPGRA